MQLFKENHGLDFLGSLWPNVCSRTTGIVRPYVPILFSKNVMIGKVNDERNAWLVDTEIINLKTAKPESIRLARQTFIGAYISFMLIAARSQGFIKNNTVQI